MSYNGYMAYVFTASVAGVQTTSFVALLGAAGFAVGLAFQGSLSNFAGGVLLLVLRPYKVGDFIEGGSAKGTVQEIGIVYTTLTTPDNDCCSSGLEFLRVCPYSYVLH